MNRRQFAKRSVAGAAGLAGMMAFGLTARGQDRPAKIRIGQIGTGHAHAAGKMESLRRLQDFEVAGVVEKDPVRRAAAERNPVYRGLEWMSEDALLAVRGLKAVAIETEVSELLGAASRAVHAGVHVHLDKPAGESLPEFRKVLDEAGRRNLTVQMGYMFRYNPAFQLCFRAIREGWLGRVFSVDAVIGKVAGAGARRELAPYRGGAMFELGCHVIDAVITVLGRPEQVIADNRSFSILGDGLADNQMAVLTYPQGVATVRSNLVEVEGFARRQFVVCGDRGTFDIRPLEPPAARLALDAPRGGYRQGYQDVTFPDTPRYDGDFLDLAKVIRGEKAFEYSPEHDLAVQETVLLASGLKVD